MMHTIPHLVKMCNFPFVERTLVMDTAPLSGDKVNRPGIGTLEQVRDNCDRLINDGIVDRMIEIDYSSDRRKALYKKHLGSSRIQLTHNYKGYPILGTIFSLEAVPGDYVLHFDSDMLMHQQADYNWIEAAIELFQRCPEIIAIRPLAGPPHPDGPQQESNFVHRSEGFYEFKTFGSRAYLLDRKRFEEFLPLPVLWRPYRQQFIDPMPNMVKNWLNAIGGKGKLGSWEIMFTNRIQASSYVRANLDNPKAWTLHPIARGPEYIQALPQIIEKIEAGWYPAEQAGYYDLKLSPWLDALNVEQPISN